MHTHALARRLGDFYFFRECKEEYAVGYNGKLKKRFAIMDTKSPREIKKPTKVRTKLVFGKLTESGWSYHIPNMIIGVRASLYSNELKIHRKLELSDLSDFVDYPRLSIENFPQRKLALLSNNTTEVLREIEQHEYRIALNKLSTLNASLRDVVLSNDLPDDVAESSRSAIEFN